MKIHRKELPFSDFEARVEAFRQAKLAHHKTVGVSAPLEHHLVEAAIMRIPRDGEADDYASHYEIIEPTLEEKKKDLDHELHKARDAALHAKLSPAKRRLFSFQHSDVINKPPHEHTDEDKDVLRKREDLVQHHDRVERHAAKMHAQIEDLTEADIDSWKPEPFPD